jgi:hypothetical protein
MPRRSTLPDTDPLAQLGIGGTSQPKREPVVAKTSIKPKPSRPGEPEVPEPAPEPKTQRRAKTPERSRAEPAAGVSRKQKLNCRIPFELADSIRDCVVALSGPPHGLTVDAFAEEAFRRELDRLRRSHNGGEPFAKRPYDPKPGRRVS